MKRKNDKRKQTFTDDVMCCEISLERSGRVNGTVLFFILNQ